jgi:glycosyltransferase involved in cell wall biosynthesis
MTPHSPSTTAAPSHRAPAQGVLAVVVIYGRTARQALAWETLCAWLANPAAAGLALRHVLVYDNSPQPTSSELASTPRLTYRHDAGNGGTRAAFMQAAALARQQGCQWLLLLDHDTRLPGTLLDAMARAIRQAPETPAAVVPRVRHGAQPISPALISDLGVIRALPLEAAPPPGSRVTAVASGSLLNVAAFEALGPIPAHLWLDGVDHWIFAGLHARRGAVRMADATLQHELSVVDVGAMPAWRLLSVLASERALLEVLPWTARLAYPYRLLRHLQRISRANPAAGRLARQWALGRLAAAAARPPRQPSPVTSQRQDDTMTTVTLLLPVYNGERFLAAQLDSLLAQTHADWICLVRDDGSSDGSMAIVRRYQARHPDRFRIIEDGLGNLGTVRCLNTLAQHVDTPLFGFCDQDDVWLPQKLEASVRALQGLQADAGVPALAYCDMLVTDEALEPLAPSFWNMTRGRRYAVGLRGLPVLNMVAGCTMLGNRALLQAAFPVPSCAPMHDYWVGLVAKFAGHAVAIEEPLMLYRQHGRNQLGAGTRASPWQRLARRIGSLDGFIAQARAARRTRVAMLSELLARPLASTDTAACQQALRAEQGSPVRRLAYLWRQGIRPDHAFVYWLA